MKVKVELNKNGVIDERADCGNIDNITWQTLDQQPEELIEGELINQKSCYEKRCPKVPLAKKASY